MRAYPEAERYLRQAISMEPGETMLYTYLAENHLLWRGGTKEARQALEAIKKEDFAPVMDWLRLNLLERNYDEALLRVSAMPEEPLDRAVFYIPKELLLGQLYQLKKQNEKSFASFKKAEIILKEKLKENVEDPRVLSSLGVVYAGLGEKEKAIQAAESSVQLQPLSRDPIIGRFRMLDLAYTYTLLGEQDKALGAIEKLLSNPTSFSIHILKGDPRWDSLRSHSKYNQILQKFS
jgi:tetratricopeptide (TPR) repeat protein